MNEPWESFTTHSLTYLMYVWYTFAIHFILLKKCRIATFYLLLKTKCLFLCFLTFVCTSFSVTERHSQVGKKYFSSIIDCCPKHVQVKEVCLLKEFSEQGDQLAWQPQNKSHLHLHEKSKVILLSSVIWFRSQRLMSSTLGML